MSKRDLMLLLEDIQQAGEKILQYTKGMDQAAFQADEKTKDAVVRNFEIIGEAANRLPQDYKTSQPQVHWKRLTGFRNRIIHEYFGVDYELVWDIISNNLPELMNEVKALTEQK